MTASTNASISLSPEDRLVLEMRRVLLPQRFPFRRDVEVAGTVAGNGGCAFYDTQWLAGGLLAMVAANVRGTGMDGVLRAGSLQRIVKSALSISLTPSEVVDLLAGSAARDLQVETLDLGIATLDTRSGRIVCAGLGRFALVGPDGLGRREEVLSRGGTVWLVAGIAEPEAASPGISFERDADSSMEQKAIGLGSALSKDCALIGAFLNAQAKEGSHEFSLTNDPTAIPGVMAGISAALEREQAPEMVTMALELSLDELLTNTVSYGYSDGGRHEILIELVVSAGKVDVCVRDDGRAFDPLSVAPPDLEAGLEDRQVGGLGVHFARTLLDEISYERKNGWNVLRLGKHFELQSREA